MAKQKEVEIKVTTHAIYKESGKIVQQTSDVETVEVVRMDQELPIATISTDRKYTQGLPNYCSASASVFCSVPTYLEESQMEAAYKLASDFCERKLAEKIKELTGK